MRRLILGLTTAALFGFAASDASACCHKKAVCAPACAPAPVCEPTCAPVKKCHFKMPKMKFGCHKKAVCAPAPACNTCGETTYAAPQAVAAPQMMVAPKK